MLSSIDIKNPDNKSDNTSIVTVNNFFLEPEKPDQARAIERIPARNTEKGQKNRRIAAISCALLFVTAALSALLGASILFVGIK